MGATLLNDVESQKGDELKFERRERGTFGRRTREFWDKYQRVFLLLIIGINLVIIGTVGLDIYTRWIVKKYYRVN